jgi:coenzyme F420 hydrogenase subunit beta
VKICPGLGINLAEVAKKVVYETQVRDNKYIGRFVKLYTGYCTDADIRFHSASGGMVTGMLIYFIEKKIIDGAVVTRFSRNDNITPETFIARTKEELISARSSKYCPVSMQGVRKRIREAKGKYIIVGLPCHLQGFRKIEETDKKFREHVFAYWGLYCSSGRTFHETDYILKTIGINKDSIRDFAYRDEGCLGSMIVEYKPKDGEMHTYKEPYGSYNNHRSFFIPRRCHFCIDHSAELSDISLGDIHIEPYSGDTIGVNSIIVRNARMDELLIQAMKNGAIVLNELSEETLISSQKMARVKKDKYASLVYWGKKIGMRVPEYGDNIRGKLNFVKALVYMCNLNTQHLIGHYGSLWSIIKYTIKK